MCNVSNPPRLLLCFTHVAHAPSNISLTLSLVASVLSRSSRYMSTSPASACSPRLNCSRKDAESTRTHELGGILLCHQWVVRLYRGREPPSLRLSFETFASGAPPRHILTRATIGVLYPFLSTIGVLYPFLAELFPNDGAPHLRNCPVYIPFLLHDIVRYTPTIGHGIVHRGKPSSFSMSVFGQVWSAPSEEPQENYSRCYPDGSTRLLLLVAGFTRR